MSSVWGSAVGQLRDLGLAVGCRGAEQCLGFSPALYQARCRSESSDQHAQGLCGAAQLGSPSDSPFGRKRTLAWVPVPQNQWGFDIGGWGQEWGRVPRLSFDVGQCTVITPSMCPLVMFILVYLVLCHWPSIASQSGKGTAEIPRIPLGILWDQNHFHNNT